MTARLWNLQGDTIQLFPDHNGAIDAVAFSPDGKTIITCAKDTIHLWNLKGKIIRKFKNPDILSSVAFSPDGDRILTGSYDKTARLWNLEGDMIQAFTGHESLYKFRGIFTRWKNNTYGIL
ncbi:MAG: hypothetical protein R2750_03935 [Bacteroidales bacterium]